MKALPSPYAIPGLCEKIELSSAVDPHSIIHTVCQFYNVSTWELRLKSRAARITWPRKIACYLLRTYTDESLHGVARLFGLDHSTVLYHEQNVKEMMTVDKELRETIKLLAPLK